MASEDKIVVELEKKLELVEAENKKLVAKLEDVQTQSAKASEEKINSLTVAVEDEKKKVEESDKKLAKAEADLAAANKELEAVKAEKDELKKEKVKTEKFSKMAKAGLSDEEAEAFLKDWDDATEAQFDKALSLKQASKAGEGSFDKPDGVKKVGEIKPGDDSGAQKVNQGGNAKPVSATASADAVVDSAVVNDETGSAAAANAANVTQIETSQAALSEFLGKSLKGNKSKRR